MNDPRIEPAMPGTCGVNFRMYRAQYAEVQRRARENGLSLNANLRMILSVGLDATR